MVFNKNFINLKLPFEDGSLFFMVNKYLILFLLTLFINSHQIIAQKENFNLKISDHLTRKYKQESKDFELYVLANNKFSAENWFKIHKVNYKILQQINSGVIIKINSLASNQINALLSKNWVLYVDRITMPKVENYYNESDYSINNVSKLHQIYPEYGGNSVTVSIKEEPFNLNDINLLGRTLNPSGMIFEQYSRHATEIATIIAGAGNSSSNEKGVAWKSNLKYSNFANLFPEEIDSLLKYNVSVQNHSYGVGIENYYGLETYLYDIQMKDNSKLLHVFSAGNSGRMIPESGAYKNVGTFANLTGQFKTSKNSISVGVVDIEGKVVDISSSGPTFDGRLKPEVVAFGRNGTSESAAMVTGIIALLQDLYYRLHNKLPNSSLIKANLINSANNEPSEISFKTGYGIVNALKSFETFRNGNFWESDVVQNQYKVHKLIVPENTKKLSVTLSWTDPASQPGNNYSLINDLDLAISKNDTIWYPWVLNSFPNQDSLVKPAKQKIDTVNNIEKIIIKNPLEGEYLIKVNGEKMLTPTQAYSLAYTIDNSNIWKFPAVNSKLMSKKNYYLRWEISNISNPKAKLQVRYINNDHPESWFTISNNIDLRKGFFKWVTPNLTTQLQVRVMNENVVLTSPTFSISQLKNFNIEYNCNENALMTWDKIDNVSNYNIYKLGDKYLELINNTADTLFLHTSVNTNSDFFTIRPVMNSIELGQTNGQFINEAIPCYISNFYLERLVSNKSKLYLNLDSFKNLKKITIEKRVSGLYEKIFETQEVDSLSYTFEDKNMPEKTQDIFYRAILKLSDETEIYSNIIKFRFFPDKKMVVYPIPVRKGMDINIYINSNSENLIEIFDLSGNLIKSSYQNSYLRKLSTIGLEKGVYIIRLTTENSLLSKKIIIL